jgi:hypothetical protein
MTCPKCGTENAPGDAFCGICGAFLEFAAEEAAEAGAPEPGWAPADAAAPGPPTDVVPVPPAAAAPTSTLAAPAFSSAGASAESPGAGATCPACGRANPAGRIFCISCGAQLPAASSRAAAPAGAAAATPGPAGPAQPTQPAWDFPTAPVPAAPPSPVEPAPGPAAGSGRRPRFPLLALAAVGAILVGGAALVALSGALGGGVPGATLAPGPSDVAASIAPSGDPSAEPGSPSPAATPVPSTPAPTPEPTPVATIPPGPAVGIKITGAKGSSQLKAQRGPKYLFDGSPATTWKSASGKFLGAWVEVRFAPAAITSFQIWTGWQKSEPLYYGNHRPQNVTVSFDGGDPVPLKLQDIPPVDGKGAQRVEIPPELGIVRATSLRIRIADVYPARETTAQDSPTNEVAISEIRVFGIPTP